MLRTGTLGLPGLQARRRRGSRHQVRRHLHTGVWGPQATAVEEGGLVQDWERTGAKRTQASACRGQAGRRQRGKQPTLARGLKGPRHSRLTPEGPDSWAPLQPHRRAGVDSALVGSAAAEAGTLSPNQPPERLAPQDKGCWGAWSPGCSQEGWSRRGPELAGRQEGKDALMSGGCTGNPSAELLLPLGWCGWFVEDGFLPPTPARKGPL